MTLLPIDALPWVIVSVQILGVVCACLARCSEGCSCQKIYQALFCLFLVLVAGSAVVSLHFGPECWLTSGSILAVMLVIATFQTSRARKAIAW